VCCYLYMLTSIICCCLPNWGLSTPFALVGLCSINSFFCLLIYCPCGLLVWFYSRLASKAPPLGFLVTLCIIFRLHAWETYLHGKLIHFCFASGVPPLGTPEAQRGHPVGHSLLPPLCHLLLQRPRWASCSPWSCLVHFCFVYLGDLSTLLINLSTLHVNLTS